MRTVIRTIVVAVLMMCADRGWAQSGQGQSPVDLGAATLEDLLNIRITTASRSSEGAAAAPARVQVVTSAQIQRRGYRSLADLLKDLPDFKVDLAGDQDYPTQITVNGTRGASRVVLLLDGVRISSPTNEPLPILANYPVHSARQIEIVYGPASALYGADAFSAVINIISKDAVDAPGLSMSLSAGQFGVYNQTASYGVRLGSKATLMIAGQALYDRQPDLSKYYPSDFQGLTAQRSGTFNTIFGPMTVERPLSPDFSIPLFAHSFQTVLRAGPVQVMLFENHSRVSTAPAYGPENAAYTPDAFNANTLVVGSATYTRPIGRINSSSTVTLSRHQLDPQSGYLNVFSNMERSYKYAYGSMAKAEEQLSWKTGRSMTFTTGGTFERFFSIPQTADLNVPVVSRERPGTFLNTNIVDDFVKLRYANVGTFGQVQYALTPAVALTLGARADYNTRYGETFNPRVGVVAQPRGGTTLKLLYGTAFLAPSPYEAYGHYGSFYSTDGGQTFASDFWHLANPNLKPQQEKTVEINLLQAVGTHFHVTASAFHARFANLIKEADDNPTDGGTYHGWPVADIDMPLNEGHRTTFGGTAGLAFLHSMDATRSIAAHLGIAVADGREKNDDGPARAVGAMVPVQLRAGADVDWHPWSIAPRMSVVGRQRVLALADDSVTRRTIDGYALVDVNLRRRALFRHVDAFVTIENAFDRRYRSINARAYTNAEELIGAPQNPRRVTVGFDFGRN